MVTASSVRYRLTVSPSAAFATFQDALNLLTSVLSLARLISFSCGAVGTLSSLVFTAETAVRVQLPPLFA
ncbi:hypothetical protein D3C72_2521190 [compost metagenome]